jgi:hypothetical protein
MIFYDYTQEAMEELGSLLQAKSLALEELNRKVEVLRDTLDCTYTGIIATFSFNKQKHQN